jgi:hypothetical protein
VGLPGSWAAGDPRLGSGGDGGVELQFVRVGGGRGRRGDSVAPSELDGEQLAAGGDGRSAGLEEEDGWDRNRERRGVVQSGGGGGGDAAGAGREGGGERARAAAETGLRCGSFCVLLRWEAWGRC